MSSPPIIDGHNDTLLNLLVPSRGGGRSFFERSERGHVDLPRMQAGNMAGGFFAMFVPTPEEEVFRQTDHGYEVELAGPIDQGYAWSQTDAMFSLLESLAADQPDRFAITLTVNQIDACLA
ncbi:MAG: peptidase, partial [Sphaerobacteraceae bacterium]